ncbi:hypothetical protein BaRGS_00005191 [Batillaria attramentaria]|uniref:Secreted protein n=1 Tax=Batillaria attramentaria TaxID=370345 RepID=A0ABD0LXG1_9CAEN
MPVSNVLWTYCLTGSAAMADHRYCKVLEVVMVQFTVMAFLCLEEGHIHASPHLISQNFPPASVVGSRDCQYNGPGLKSVLLVCATATVTVVRVPSRAVWLSDYYVPLGSVQLTLRTTIKYRGRRRFESFSPKNASFYDYDGTER